MASSSVPAARTWCLQRSAQCLACAVCRRQRAALLIQTAWRGHKCRRAFLRMRKGVLAAQCCWRRKQARRELRRRRAEAREAGKLLQVQACVRLLPARLHSGLQHQQACASAFTCTTLLPVRIRASKAADGQQGKLQ